MGDRPPAVGGRPRQIFDGASGQEVGAARLRAPPGPGERQRVQRGPAGGQGEAQPPALPPRPAAAGPLRVSFAEPPGHPQPLQVAVQSQMRPFVSQGTGIVPAAPVGAEAGQDDATLRGNGHGRAPFGHAAADGGLEGVLARGQDDLGALGHAGGQSGQRSHPGEVVQEESRAFGGGRLVEDADPVVRPPQRVVVGRLTGRRNRQQETGAQRQDAGHPPAEPLSCSIRACSSWFSGLSSSARRQ